MATELKARYIIRKDLNMSPGKIAAQVGHGTDMIHLHCDADSKETWLTNRTKIVLGVKSETALRNIIAECQEQNIPHREIWDLGRTELNGETLTGIVVFPTFNLLPKKIEKLQTLK